LEEAGISHQGEQERQNEGLACHEASLEVQPKVRCVVLFHSYSTHQSNQYEKVQKLRFTVAFGKNVVNVEEIWGEWAEINVLYEVLE
jgi:hypothetical protein